MIIFDEFDEYYRYPAGAVQTPGGLRLRIKLLRGFASGVSVWLRPDGGGAVRTDMVFAGVTGAFDVYECALKFDIPGLYWYHFLVESANGEELTLPEHSGGAFQLTACLGGAKAPDWIQGGFIYHIFVDRFWRGGKLNLRPGAVFREDWGENPYFLPDEKGIVRNNDFFGGDLFGVIEKLPYLKGLGVTCIYLSPVFEAASNHKYDTGDFMSIDPAFGGDDALESLCAEASGLGITVILDGVFNHVGSDSRYFNRYGRYEGTGAYQAEDSPYRKWFSFREDGTYEAWWGIELLPALNKSSESYREFICGSDGVIAKWMRKGVSGWRLDVVDELPDVFLDPLCRAMRREKSDALIVGEVWEDASNKIAYDVRRRYFLGGQLDSVTNYPLRDAIIACVTDAQVERIASLMDRQCQNYPENVLSSLMNILGTHDTMRILTVLGGANLPQTREEMASFRLNQEQLETAKRRLKLASTIQFTLPGVPCVFYGDEAGMEGGADPFCRKCYPWGREDSGLTEWYARLGKIRNERKCFSSGKYVLVEARAGVFAFTRGEGSERVLVAVNAGDDDRILQAGDFNFDLLKNEYTDSLTIRAGKPAIFAIQ